MEEIFVSTIRLFIIILFNLPRSGTVIYVTRSTGDWVSVEIENYVHFDAQVKSGQITDRLLTNWPTSRAKFTTKD